MDLEAVQDSLGWEENCLTSQTQPTLAWILKAICAGVGWVWLVRLGPELLGQWHGRRRSLWGDGLEKGEEKMYAGSLVKERLARLKSQVM